MSDLIAGGRVDFLQQAIINVMVRGSNMMPNGTWQILFHDFLEDVTLKNGAFYQINFDLLKKMKEDAVGDPEMIIKVDRLIMYLRQQKENGV